MIYVTDTHSFLWFLTEDDKLGQVARSVFDDAEEGKNIIIIPTIVLAESMYILEKLNAARKFQEITDKIENGWNYVSIPLDMKIIKHMQRFVKLSDIHDRIIVSSADIMKAKLITKDSEITKSRYVEIVW